MLAGLLAGGGHRYYRHWQPARLQRLAEKELAAGRPREACLFLERALQMDPNNLAASRTLARLYNEAALPAALVWWQRVVELEPTETKNKLELAAAGIRFGRSDIAKSALEGVPLDARGSLDYLGLSGALAFGERRFEEAARIFSEAQQLDPSNQEHTLNLANARLNSADPDAQKTALAVIAQVAEGGGPAQLAALRILRQREAAAKNWPEAIRWSGLIGTHLNAQWGDRLVHLSLLRESRSADFEASLVAAEQDARVNLLKAEAMLKWLHERGLFDRAIAFFSKLDQPLSLAPELRGIVGGCLDSKKEWTTLRDFVTQPPEKWGDREFFRLALLARAEDGLGNRERAEV